jgi:putative transposase
MNNKIICPHCKSNKVIKRGFRKTKNRGKIQRYSCKNCSHRFVEDEGFFRMRNNPKKITLCLDLFYKGISTRQIQEHLQQFYPHNSSNVSIYKWVVRYSKQISKFTDSLKLKVGRELQIDEMEFNRRKSHKAKLGNDRNWFIDCIDTKTRFLVSAELFETREQREVIKVLRQAKIKCGTP